MISAVSRGRRARHWLALCLAGIAISLTGCTQAIDGSPSGGSSTAGSAPSGPRKSGSPASGVGSIAFHDCSALLMQPGVKIPPNLQGHLSASCGVLPVPLDYAHPAGKTIGITVVRVHDDQAGGHPPALLLNPGGPGASGILLLLGLLHQLPAQVTQHYDLIGFDPRGVYLSSPIRCVSDAAKDKLLAEWFDVSTPTGFAEAKHAAQALAGACERKYGTALQFYDTVNTARDMDRIRAALGERETDYLGFSYGTELGSVYAHLFPKRVGTMVLDGAVDPLTNSVQQFAYQLQGFEHSYDQFAAWCVGQSPCRQLGPPRQAAEAITAKALRSPIATGTSRPLTFALAETGILQALYSRSAWPRLGKALLAARSGNGSDLLSLADQYNERQADGHYTNILDANTTISCNDSPPGPSDATISRLARQWPRRFPLFGAWSVPSLFSCQQWQPHRTPPPKPTAPTTTKVLVVGNLHDPATPYQGAKDLTRVMGNAELLTWNGEGHTSYLEGSGCINRYVTAYLVTDKLPPPSTVCPR